MKTFGAAFNAASKKPLKERKKATSAELMKIASTWLPPKVRTQLKLEQTRVLKKMSKKLSKTDYKRLLKVWGPSSIKNLFK